MDNDQHIPTTNQILRKPDNPILQCILNICRRYVSCSFPGSEQNMREYGSPTDSFRKHYDDDDEKIIACDFILSNLLVEILL